MDKRRRLRDRVRLLTGENVDHWSVAQLKAKITEITRQKRTQAGFKRIPKPKKPRR